MTDSPYIHHRPTLRRLPGTAVVFPDLEPHQKSSGGVRLGLAAGRHRPVDARGGRSPPSCQRTLRVREVLGRVPVLLLSPHPSHRPSPPLKRHQADPRFVPPAR